MVLLCAFAAILAALSLAACGKDDDNDSGGNNGKESSYSIVGNWINEEDEDMLVVNTDHLYWLSYYDGKIEKDDYGRYVYNADDKVIEFWEPGDEDEEPYLFYVTWLDKDRFHLMEEDGDSEGVYTRTSLRYPPERWNH